MTKNIILQKYYIPKICFNPPKCLQKMVILSAKMNALCLYILGYKKQIRIMIFLLHVLLVSVKGMGSLEHLVPKLSYKINFKNEILTSFPFKKMSCTNYNMCLKAIIGIIYYVKFKLTSSP